MKSVPKMKSIANNNLTALLRALVPTLPGLRPGCGPRPFACLLALVLGGPAAGRADVVQLPAVADTFLHGGAPENNAGGHAWFDAGTDGLGGVRRGLIRFDLTVLPAGSTVTSAVLTLTVVQSPGFGGSAVDSTMDLFRVLAAWNEGAKTGNNGALASPGEATWNARMAGSANWTVPGAAADAAATSSAAALVGAPIGATYSWSGTGLVSDVQFWLDNPAANHGWLLRSQLEATPRTVRGFASRENTSGQPVLTVGYSPPPNVPPQVTLISPTNNGTFVSGVPLTLQAVASDSDGSVTNVEFFANGVSLGSDPTGPDYSVTATLYTGVHLLTAVATDNRGAATVSATVTNTGITVPIPNPIAERIPKGDITVELRTVVDGLAAPLGMAVPDDGSGRMFVYDQEGRVWVVTASGRLSTPLLDVRSRLVLLGAYDERGLLGLAVHPDFAQHPLVYTYTSEPQAGTADFLSGLGTSNNHHSVIAEWRISAANSNVVDTTTRREILRIEQPQSNHNGGAMAFGPDGKLYVALGDGGSANDVAPGHVPGGNAQDLNRIWGKLLRLDVDARTSPNGQYGVPADNPFVGVDGLDEIWASGLRNPFSFSFERGTTNLYLADVGQNRVEEINLIIKGGNYGWNVKEGSFWFDGAGNVVTAPVRPPPPGLVDPIAEYDHDDGLAVIGGYVYRGTAIPALVGRYVFGDWGAFNAPSGRLFYLDAGNVIKELRLGREDRPLGLWLRGFGEGPDGELYLFASKQLGPSGNTGRMLKLVPVPAAIQLTGPSAPSPTHVTATWTGGAGPFALQKKTTLADPLWQNNAVVATPPVTVLRESDTGFYRVRDAATQIPTPFSAHLTGAAEPPANGSTATGFACSAWRAMRWPSTWPTAA